MKILRLIVLAPALLLLSCTPPENAMEGYTKIFTFKDTKGEVLGDAYVKYINDKVFTSMVIKKNEDVLYSIDENKFLNREGIDFTVKTDEDHRFYGYEIVIVKDDYIQLVYRSNEGENVSDPVTVSWEEDEKLFRKHRPSY